MKLDLAAAVGLAVMEIVVDATKTTRRIPTKPKARATMTTDFYGKELMVGDAVIYTCKDAPKPFSLRGEVVDIINFGIVGGIGYMVDIRVDFINKNRANDNQIVRVLADSVMKYDAERTIFV